MRKLLPVLLLSTALSTMSAVGADRPANLQAVPEPAPPPPPVQGIDPSLEPQVTIIKSGTDTIEEYRVSGKLYMIKVTPSHGISYYLIDEKGDGRMTRQDSLDSGIRPPMWVIHSW